MNSIEFSIQGNIMNKNYLDFFKIIKKLNDDGVINSKNYLDDVLKSLTKEFIPDDKVFFSSNCPHGRDIEIPYSVPDEFFIVIGANYPIGKENEILLYKVDKSKIKNLLKNEYYHFTKEILLRMTPVKVINLI
ncbi:MAG: hypothetical protein JW702_08505 [Clostridiales bacterium]|nr:hypothetical protein [Clostridiales bacterium]